MFTHVYIYVVVGGVSFLIFRHARRKGNFLCKQLPAGCSVVVVKDYKVIFYSKNDYRATSAQKSFISSERGLSCVLRKYKYIELNVMVSH